MALLDRVRRIFGGGETRSETAAAYRCETCGAEFDSVRSICTQCGGQVRETEV